MIIYNFNLYLYKGLKASRGKTSTPLQKLKKLNDFSQT